ncbi:hypothetical protein VWY74_01570 [Phaeobacter sp. JH20_24]|uniref:hypothetical protein n=1 Tax=unclassified Phaeobacter TaxID=2621772 RepID=UPI003A83C4D1
MKKDKNPDSEKQESTTLDKSEIMQKVLADMERFELSFCIDEAKFEAKQISGNVTIHLRQSGNA